MQDPLIIGSQVVGLIYIAKRQRRLGMSDFAILVGMIDGLVSMSTHAQNPETDALHNPSAHGVVEELLQGLEEGLSGILDGVAASMLITRRRLDELVACGEILPTELLIALRDELKRTFAAATPAL